MCIRTVLAGVTTTKGVYAGVNDDATAPLFLRLCVNHDSHQGFGSVISGAEMQAPEV